MVEREHRCDSRGEEVVDQAFVEVHPRGVGRAAAGGLDPRPRDGESIAVEPELGHQCDVLAVPVVVVAGHRCRAAVDDPSGLHAERVPDAGALPVSRRRTLDLVGRRARSEPEVAWKGP